MKIQENTLLKGRIKLLQFARGAKATGDSIILAAALDEKVVKPHARILDVGCGGGAVSMCLLERFPHITIDGLDIDGAQLELADKSAALNGFEARFKTIEASIFGKSNSHEYNVVITNPPYFKGRGSADSSRAKARIEDDLPAWLSASIKRLKSGGLFAMIHDAGRITEILSTLHRQKMGRIEIFPFYSKQSSVAASRIVVRAIKGSKSPSEIKRPMVMHNELGGFSRIAGSLFEEGKSLLDIIEDML
jgi:tRNA1(Val) A37 N6-methylase TrmN6